MDYVSILKRVWEIILNRPYLWLFGVLAGGTGYYSPFTYQFNAGDYDIEEWFQETQPSQELNQNLALAAQALARDPWQELTSFFSSNWQVITLIGIGIFLLSVIFLIISISSSGGLIAAVAKEDQQKSPGFVRAFKEGFKYFWPIFWLKLIIFLSVLVLFSVFIAPIVMFSTGGMAILAIIWGTVIFLVFLVGALLISLLVELSLRYIVLRQSGVWQALIKSLALVQSQLKEVLGVWFINIIISFIGSFVLFVVFLVVIAVGAIFVAIVLPLVQIGGIIIASIFGFILLAVGLVAFGILNSFKSGFWTLSFVKILSSI